MTSSLVGSEMCIRDRGGPLRCVRHGPPLPGATAGHCHHGLQLPQYSLAVSYTHLTLPTICSV
eukprot:8528869-Prorocentrum_lima.AAC.1